MDAAPPAPVTVRPGLERGAGAGLTALLVLCTAVSVGWLAVGAVVATARYVPAAASAVAAAADGGSAWARAVADAAPRSEPLGQALLDYAFSIANLVLAAVLLLARVRTWSARLLAVALVGSAGAFNLQAHAAAVTVEAATGLSVGPLHQMVLHGIACAAYILALLVFPTPSWVGNTAGRSVRAALALTGAVTLLLVGLGTALLPHTTSCVLFFGFLVPVVGLLVLPSRIRRGPTGEERGQARLLFSVLGAAFAVAVVFAIVTVLLSAMGGSVAEPLLTLVDPTAHGTADGTGEPTALLFWWSRFASAALVVAVVVATRRDDLWAVEGLFSRGLATVLVVVGVGGGFVVLRTLAGGAVPPWLAGAVATVAAGLAFGPVFVRAERTVDRLLYGTRPTPYSALADIAVLTRSTAAGAPDLARVAEAVARVLGAQTCRLTVLRPGLRDRTYTWTAAPHTAFGPDDLVELPIHHSDERVGAIAVDRQAVAGLHEQRHHLLEDIAGGLGVVLQASRSGIELERQLRAALAHAEEIAVSRRRAVAAMDGERRRIERDLHDGAQHHLVSLGLTLGLVELQTSHGALDDARRRLGVLTEQLGAAEAVLTETVNGVTSLLLEEQGLVAALGTELAAAHPPVGFDAGGLPPGRRFPGEIEAAVWFCVAEAVGNARKHAEGAPVSVHLAERAGVLTLVVRDEGPGFAADRSPDGRAGRGFRNLTTRIGAVGGSIAVRSAPGAGTTVEGRVRLPATAEQTPDPGSALTAQVREVARRACAAYRGSPARQRVEDLAHRLDEPVRIAVLGADDDRAAFVASLVGAPVPRPARPGPGVPVWYAAGRGPAGARDAGDAVVALPAPALRAMTLVDVPDDDAVGPGGPADASGGRVPDRVRTLLGVPGGDAAVDAVVLLLRSGRSADLRVLDLLHAAGHRGAVAVVLGSEDAAESADRAAGVHRTDPVVRRVCRAVVTVPASGSGDGAAGELRELVEALIVRRADALRARSVLAGLEAVVRSVPPDAATARDLRFQLERIRAGAHELRELELLDVLQSGGLPLADDDLRAAELLLGAGGRDVRSRLGLAPDAGTERLRAEAARQPARWRELAMHPVASARLREAAQLLVRASEELVVQVGVPADAEEGDPAAEPEAPVRG